MNTKTAAQLLPCFQPGHDPGKEARLLKAVRFAEGDPELKPRLEAQTAFDTTIAGKLGEISVPPGLAGKLAALEEGERAKAWYAPLTNPAVLAAVLSLAIVGFLVVHTLMERSEDFQGRDVAEKMVGSAAQMTGVEFEPIKPTELGRLNDWFAMNGVERFETPTEFATFKAVGCRVYKQAGFPIAQALVEENNMLVYVFRGADLGIDPAGENWRVFTADEYTGAIRGLGDLCFMIGFRGNKAGMEQFLSGLHRPAPR
jgi:hypothetical protein